MKLVWKNETMPEELWTMAITCQTFKKRNARGSKNYRGISFVDARCHKTIWSTLLFGKNDNTCRGHRSWDRYRCGFISTPPITRLDLVWQTMGKHCEFSSIRIYTYTWCLSTTNERMTAEMDRNYGKPWCVSESRRNIWRRENS